MFLILIRGGGDLATGVAIRLLRSGLKVVMTELAEPLAVRRTVSFSEAVFKGQITIEGISASRLHEPINLENVVKLLSRGVVPVIVDPECVSAQTLQPGIVVDARMIKKNPETIRFPPSRIIGLGPGFTAGHDCRAVIETHRGHFLGRVYWQDSAEPDNGQPAGDPERALRAPGSGVLKARKDIGEVIEANDLIAEIKGLDSTCQVRAPIRGLLRGLLRSGSHVIPGMKIGDVDPRTDARLCSFVSDKSLAVGGGVFEALVADPDIRSSLWD